jgi:4'-phosphopantetheinyl transferase EntD
VIEQLLPRSARAVEVFADPPGATLYPEEEACVARAVDSRRREFTTGRYCARAALVRLGLTPAAIVKGARGAPHWPDGVVGSITHCAGYRGAAVARSADMVAIGIDAEPNEPLPGGVAELVSLPGERARLASLADAYPEVAWDRLLFSAKESVYKAWAPITRSFLDFLEADVTFDPAACSFVARLLVPDPALVGGSRGELRGRFAVRDGLTVTAVCRAHDRGRPPNVDSAERELMPH